VNCFSDWLSGVDSVVVRLLPLTMPVTVNTGLARRAARDNDLHAIEPLQSYDT